MAPPSGRWLVLPYTVIYFVGAAGAATIALTALKMSGNELVKSWWIAFLPLLLALTFIFVLFTIAMILWVVVAVKLCAGHTDVEVEGDSFNLDMLFRTAKICFLGHGYTLLLCIACWLMILKLESWHTCPIIYPLIPIVILGAMHVFLAIMFKSPELDAGRSSFIGVSMLGHAIMLTIKIDHFHGAENSMPWAFVFLPSWFTYAGVLMYAGSHLTYGLGQMMRPPENSTAGSSTEKAPTKTQLQSQLRTQSVMLVGIAVWAVGFAFSQVFVTLRLDKLSTTMSWELMLLPAMIGWVVMVICCAPPIVNFFAGIVHTFRIQLDPSAAEDEEAKEPILPGDSRVPLPWH